MAHRWRLRGAAALAAAVVALMVAAGVLAATVTPAGSKQQTQQTNNTFYMFDDIQGVPIVLPGNAQLKMTLYDSKAWYDPGAPYVVSPMLASVLGYSQQTFATSGLAWTPSMSFSVPGVGTLNSYMVSWASGGSGAYALGCNMWISPPLHDCKRGTPDWLIATNLSLKLDYQIFAGLPWFAFDPTANSHTISYGWW